MAISGVVLKESVYELTSASLAVLLRRSDPAPSPHAPTIERSTASRSGCPSYLSPIAFINPPKYWAYLGSLASTCQAFTGLL